MSLLFNSSAADHSIAPRTSFSGADIRAVILRPGYRTELDSTNSTYPNSEAHYHELGSIQTLSLSIFRDKREVRCLGFQGIQGLTRGSRTIAGSLIFAMLDRHPFNDTGAPGYDLAQTTNSGILRSSSGVLTRDLMSEDPEQYSDPIVGRRHQYDFTWDSQTFGQLMFTDELPPFDIIITFVNEAGGTGAIKLYGVDIHHEGMTLSIEDLFTEVTYSYTARGATMFEEGSFQGRLWSGPDRPFNSDWALREMGRRL